MTNQEIFDKVSKHLLIQKCKSMNTQEECQYRGENTSCAVGCLIPDDLYDSIIEGWVFVGSDYSAETVGEKKLHRILSCIGITKENDRIIKDLQHCHDSNAVSMWREQLFYIAGKHLLSIKELRTII